MRILNSSYSWGTKYKLYHQTILRPSIPAKFNHSCFYLRRNFLSTPITMVQQDPNQISQLVRSLEAAKGKKKSGRKTFSCKKTNFPVAGSQNISVDSWRFQDWDYKLDDLPTYARGLFTTVTKNNTPEIAVRGYDKFFNVDEVNSTKWRNIENNTRGPYELSVKENGCIIFISGLEDGTLLVCSKHSTGARQDTDRSHAQVGQHWVRKHVASVGKSEKALAMELRRMNATAVGELCDDSFEEHVLAYSEDASGIYLHGINYNVPEFATLPSPEVHRFADAWGFKKAQFLVKHDLPSVKSFLDQCAETGSWNGKDTEGFVIRCQMREVNAGPYQDWFFKYKFEEPYLMYRQWREATKALISGKPPKYKKHVKITEEYLQYARRHFINNPNLKKLYNQNHGIIALRNGFLKERGLGGSEIIAMEAAQGGDAPPPISNNVVLVPIASLGCGKTTVALGLKKLFGWAHVQNDNIEGRGNRPRRFAQELVNSLGGYQAVFADRNNHQKRERQQIFADVRKLVPEARFIALHYVHEPKGKLLAGIRQITQQRVLDRGDNHQTIQAGSKNESEIIDIMEGFLRRFEAVGTDHEPDINFDDVIDLDVTASSRDNLETVVNTLYSNYPKLVDREKPSALELDNAINAAMHDYTVEVKHDLSFRGGKPLKQPRPIPTPDNREQLLKRIEYFNISVSPSEIKSLVSSLFSNPTSPEMAMLYNNLLKTRRIQPSFHVTLIHRAISKDQPEIWDQYKELYTTALESQPETAENRVTMTETKTRTIPTPVLGSACVQLERLIWDDKIMALVVRVLPPDHDSNPLLPKHMEYWPCANQIPHITIGTSGPDVKPKESNTLIKRWLEHGANAESGIYEAEIPPVKVIKGAVGMVPRR